MQRRGVTFSLNIKGMGKLKGEGKVVLTTHRLVLINPGGPNDFKSADLPLALTYNEKFEQPIFGANAWSGKCKAMGNSLPGEIEFYIKFKEGGC